MAANNWDERYRQGEHAHDAPLEFIARLVPPGEGRRALDLACGAGRHAALLADRGWNVTAVDGSAVALEMTRARDARIHTVLADLEAGAFPIERNAWDLICVSFYMQRDLFPAIRQGLRRPGGLVVVALPLIDEREGVRPMRREFLVEPGELPALFEDGFEILHNVETEPAPPKRRTAEFIARATDKGK